MRTFSATAIVIIACALMDVCQDVSASEEPGRVGGRVTDPEGASLPGDRMSLFAETGAKLAQRVTDTEGRFEFVTGPDVRIVSVTAELPGFETEFREEIAVAPGETVTLHVLLKLACVEPDLPVDEGLSTTLRTADAAVYIRVLHSSELKPFRISDSECFIAREHTAQVLDAITMRPVQRSELRWLSDLGVGPAPHPERPNEYVVLLWWDERIKAYRNYGYYVFPVYRGRVTWHRTDAPKIRDGSPVSAVLKVLVSMYRSPH